MSLLKNNLIAHNVKTEGNVASTFHIEPNHNPKAREISQAWFALTKSGGEVIPLDRCNCQFRIISNNQTILKPMLRAVSAEQYKGIPGAAFTFPKAGIYTLEISGTPKFDDNEFNAFKFTYDVTVQAGSASQPGSELPLIAVSPPPKPTNWVLVGTIGALIVLTCAWIVKRTLKN